MNRRNFLAGLLALPVLGLNIQGSVPKTEVVTNTTKQLRQWEPVAGIQFDPLRDGPIVAMNQYHDSLIVTCKWTIWEIRPYDGEGMVARLITRVVTT